MNFHRMLEYQLTWQINLLCNDFMREVWSQDGDEFLQLLGIAGHERDGLPCRHWIAVLDGEFLIFR